MATAVLASAKRFDLWTEQLLDKYMCSDICPCSDYPTAKGSTRQIFLKEKELLEAHKRTFDLEKSKEENSPYVYMHFTSPDVKKSFKNSLECFDYYEEMSTEDDAAIEKFEVDIQKFL